MHPYTTQARVELFLGPARLATLLDRNEDLVVDTGLFDAACETVCNRIDGALAGRYSVPFASLTDTPGQVIDLANLGIGMQLFKWLAPASDDATQLREDFEGEDGSKGLLGRYRTGVEVIPGAAEVAASTASRSCAFESIGTSVAGALDSSGSRTGVWSQTTSTDQGDGI